MTPNRCTQLANLRNSKMIEKLENAYALFLKTAPCIVCLREDKNLGEGKIHIHHEALSYCFSHNKRFTNFQALPLCNYHHDERHRMGMKFYEKYFDSQIVPFFLAAFLIDTFMSELGVDVKALEDIKHIEEDEDNEINKIRKMFDDILLGIFSVEAEALDKLP